MDLDVGGHGPHHPRPRGLPLEELLRWEGPDQLRILTCGGSFDAARGSYRHNVVIHAVTRGDPLPPGAKATVEPEDASR